MDIEIVSRLRGEKLNKWTSLMADGGLTATSIPQRVVLVWDGEALIASGGRDGNILKQLAVSSGRQGEDLLSTVLTELKKDAFDDGHTHLFLYTKPSNKLIFTSLFFYPVAETDKVLVMENKRDGIKLFLDGLPTDEQTQNVGAIVMNCNPFTLGHRYLIETASSECDRVYVFVLSEEGSGFSAKDRLAMVKLGTSHLPNVTVLQTGPYLISSATFPTYFLKDRDSAETVHCDVDIEIFLKYFVPKFSIKRRYVGTEPLSQMTDKYNCALREKLPTAGIELREIERKENGGIPISASAVRRLAEEGKLDELKKIVPKTTYDYLTDNNLI